MGTIRLGKRTEGRSPKIKDFVPLAGLDDLVFTGWDIFEDDMYAAAGKAGVLDRSLLEQVKPFLSSIKPRKAVFDKNYVKKLDGPNVKKGKNKMELAEQVRDDIREFKQSSGADRLVMIWCGSTETFIEPAPRTRSRRGVREGAARQRREHRALDDLRLRRAERRRALRQRRAESDRRYSRRCTRCRKQMEAPICGKDYKTGQTLIKTILAPGFKARMTRPERLVLHQHSRQPRRRSARRSGLIQDQGRSRSCRCWSTSCSRSSIPIFTATSVHKVRINYYPPRGDNKEGWDNIDIFGWLGYPMQIKVDFLCRDSILAAPLVLDLVLFSTWRSVAGAARHRHPGVAELLLQVADDAPRAVSRARPVHPVDEAEEHPAPPDGRGDDHAPRAGVLRAS